MTPEMELINNGLADLQKALMKSIVAMSSQIAETQAAVSVLLELERDRLVQAGQSQQAAQTHIEARQDAYRTIAQNSLIATLEKVLGASFETFDFGDSVN